MLTRQVPIGAHAGITFIAKCPDRGVGFTDHLKAGLLGAAHR